MLVLGDEAQENGLAVSLLERLQKHYEMIGSASKPYCATLVTNYRCHEKIVQLSEKLFYETPLKCNVSSASTHPDAPFPLRFICSSVDDTLKYVEDAKNGKEANIALWEAARIAEKWPVDRWGPKDLAQTCFMSTARSQVSLDLGYFNIECRAQASIKIICQFLDYPGSYSGEAPYATQDDGITEIPYI